jgi:hypothetical protein
MANEILYIPSNVGELYLTPIATYPTSIYCGGLQEMSIDFAGTIKGFKGAYVFDIAQMRTGVKVTGKAKYGAFNIAAYASILGGTVATGTRLLIQAESTGTISGATYTAANPTGFEDKGVLNAAGVQLTRVAPGSPATLQYAVTAGGVYTFNADMTGTVGTIRYTYTVVTGKTLTISNQLMGAVSNTYILDYYSTSDSGGVLGFRFNKVVIPKLTLPMKNEDFTVQDIDLEFYPDTANTLGNIFKS